MSTGRMRGVITPLAALVLSLVPAMGVPADASGPATSVAAAALSPGVGCVRTRATGAIRPGMTGIGWTTVRGDRPEPFRVRVLGTLRDGIGPGRDLIIVKVSDLPGRRVIRVGGGIWSGMSGSPVYILGTLAGAISYSLSDGPSAIGGMTPARYMERLQGEPPHAGASHAAHAGASRAASAVRAAGPSMVRVSGSLGASAATAAGRPGRRSLALRRLGIPVAVSGAVGTRRSFVARQLRRQFGSVRLVSTGAATASSGTGLATPPRAGQNLAGVIARGDVTVAAVGTVTGVCHGRVTAFGHPMTGDGAVAYAAARARTVAIVDGADPYKLANIGRTFGALDVDRLTGVRALAGVAPRTLPITARVRSLSTGRTRTGRTRVSSPGWMTTVAADHLLYDIQAVDERYGSGTAQLRWTIRGTRLDTDASWALHWTDRVSDPTDIAYASALRLYAQLDALVTDPTTAARIRSVSIEATIGRGSVTDRIRRVEVSRNGGPWVGSGPIAVGAGDELRVRVHLRARSGRTYVRVVGLVVPSGATGRGLLHVLGGSSAITSGCDPIDGACPTTFGGLLDELRDAPRGDDLLVALDLHDAGGGSLRVASAVRLDHVVSGARRLRLDAG